jgi:gliding motility-associated-like protein
MKHSCILYPQEDENSNSVHRSSFIVHRFLRMKKETLLLFFLLTTFSTFAQYEVLGGEGTPLLALDNTQNRLKIYLLYSMNGAHISFTSENLEAHQWYRYNKRATEAEPVPSTQVGNTSVITDIKEGYGYFVGLTNSPSTSYVWIIDYKEYLSKLHSLVIEEEVDKCESLKLIADMDAPGLLYYTPIGAPMEVQRTYTLSYLSAEWHSESQAYVSKEIVRELNGIVREIEVHSVFQNTDFKLSGDRFAEHFGKGQVLTTPVYEAISVDVHVKNGENEFIDPKTNLEGSAPMNLTLTAYANEPVAAFYIWKISKRNDPLGTWEPIVRYTDKTLRYTFEKWGNFRVELEVINRNSVCVDTTQVFNVVISNTEIKIPNAFSPGSSLGVNDEFRISATSVISFRASIYNRWGNLLYQWTDPSKGWNGRVNGKYVPTGVFYVVVEYTDADGKKRSVSKDINVLREQY